MQFLRLKQTEFFDILGHFLPFYSLKNENSKKKMKKTPGDIIILYKCTKNNDHMVYFSWDMALDRCNCYFSFWAIFAPKIKMSKKWKKDRDIIILHKCTKNHDHMLYCSGDMVCDGCNCYFPFWAFFALLPRNSPKNQPGDIIILHTCTKNYD